LWATTEAHRRREQSASIQRLVEESLDLTPQVVIALAGFGEERRVLANRARGRRLIEILDLSRRARFAG
jgi:hypothetical protein